jgi:integrase/recombinase XerD
MLTIYRRHTHRCPNDSRDAKKCHCPIWMDWTMQGRRIRKPLGIRDWQAAQIRAREMEATGLEKAGEVVTIKNATEAFEKDAVNNIKTSTLKQYKILFARLNKSADNRGFIFLRQLGVVEVRDFRNSWTTYSPRTAGKHIERTKRFFNWCVENEWLTASPAKPLKSPKAGDTDVIRFSEEEVTKIPKACDSYEGRNRERLRLLTDLMLSTGLAIGDASTISKDRIVKTSNGYSVELRRAKTGTPVSCPIPPKLAKGILGLDGDTPFWSGKSDLEDVTKNWRKIYTKVFKAAGVEGHPHQFRHTTAKRLLVAGVPVGYVASVLGHSVTICEKHYSKWIPERQAAVENAIRGTWKR